MLGVYRSQQIATDNAVSALGKIMDIHNQAQLVKPWLSYLPLRGDRTESKSVLQHLLKLVAEKPGLVCGQNFANAGLLIKAMIKYLQLPKVASEEEIRKLRATLQQVCGLEHCLLCRCEQAMYIYVCMCVCASYIPLLCIRVCS